MGEIGRGADYSRSTAKGRTWWNLPVTDWRPSPMRKSTTKQRRKKAPKRILALPDLEQSKARQHFHRHRAIEPRVAGLIHLAHPAGAER
jgi:hypothetical protein